MKKILLGLFLSVFVIFGVSKSFASCDVVVLNTNNGKYHKTDCEYAKYIKNGKNMRKPIVRYSAAACCFPQKEKKQSFIQKYKEKRIFNKINEQKISLFFVDPVKAKKAQNKILAKEFALLITNKEKTDNQTNPCPTIRLLLL